jgi:hypothetical protein
LASCSRRAAAMPADPPPTIKTSTSLVPILALRRCLALNIAIQGRRRNVPSAIAVHQFS